MLSMFDSVIGFLTLRTYQKPRMTYHQRYIENYLANSADLVDLERRQRELTRKGYYF